MRRALLVGFGCFALALPIACSDGVVTGTANDSTQTDAGGTDDASDNVPDDVADPCSAYCATIQSACSGGFGMAGANSQYASAQGCMSFCGGALPTDNSGGTRDTLDCRMTHAGRAKANPASECPIAGTSGGGVCDGDPGDAADRGRCAAFCSRAMQLCTPDNGVSPPPYADEATCMTACGQKFHFDPSQPELTTSGDTLNCRQYYLMLAFDGTGVNTPAYHCPHLAAPASAFCQ